MDLLNFIAPGKQKQENPINGTQLHLRIAEIKENVIILKNGGIRSVLRTSSINFNLKSEQEQNAIIRAYQNFLNSLEFPVQILVRSKKLNLDNYIEGLKKLGSKQQNTLLQEQTYEYAEYIEKLIEYADIMDKEFYIIVPYEPIRIQNQNLIQNFFQRLSPKDSFAEIKRRREEFNNLKKNLAQRVNVIKSNIENCSLITKELETKELIELFYEVYNPQTARSQKITDQEKTDLQIQ